MHIEGSCNASSEKGAQNENFWYRIRNINCKTTGKVFSPHTLSYRVLDPIKKKKKKVTSLWLSTINSFHHTVLPLFCLSSAIPKCYWTLLGILVDRTSRKTLD